MSSLNTTTNTTNSTTEQQHTRNNPSKKNYHLPSSPKSSPLNLSSSLIENNKKQSSFVAAVDIEQSYYTTSSSSTSITSNIPNTMARSESFAYANSSTDHMSRLLLFFRSNSTAVTATVGFLIFILLVTSDAIMKGETSGYSGLRP